MPLLAPSLDDVLALLGRPLLELVFEAAGVHRSHHDPSRIQCAQLLSIKTGGCPEDCGYCSQSAHHATGLVKEKLLDTDEILGEARRAKAGGADRFCMGAAWREVKDGAEFDGFVSSDCSSQKRDDLEHVVDLVEPVHVVGPAFEDARAVIRAHQRFATDTGAMVFRVQFQ